jgi:hypothetical protein
MVRKPDWRVVAGFFFTNMNGKVPVMKVTRKLIRRGVKAESNP